MSEQDETRELLKAQRGLMNTVILEWVARFEVEFSERHVKLGLIEQIVEDMKEFATQ